MSNLGDFGSLGNTELLYWASPVAHDASTHYRRGAIVLWTNGQYYIAGEPISDGTTPPNAPWGQGFSSVIQGPKGQDAHPLQEQYSDSSDPDTFRDTPNPSADRYIRFSNDGGTTWDDPIEFKGPKGDKGDAATPRDGIDGKDAPPITAEYYDNGTRWVARDGSITSDTAYRLVQEGNVIVGPIPITGIPGRDGLDSNIVFATDNTFNNSSPVGRSIDKVYRFERDGLPVSVTYQLGTGGGGGGGAATGVSLTAETLYFDAIENVGTTDRVPVIRTNNPITVRFGGGSPSLIRIVAQQTAQVEFLKAGVYEIHLDGLVNARGRGNSLRLLPRIRLYDVNDAFVAEIDDHYHRTNAANSDNLQMSGDGVIYIPTDNYVVNIRIAQEIISDATNFDAQANWNLTFTPFGGGGGISAEDAEKIAEDVVQSVYTPEDQAQVAKIQGILDRLNNIHDDINFAIVDFRNGQPRPPFKSETEAFAKGLLTIGVGLDGEFYSLKDTPATDAKGTWTDFVRTELDWDGEFDEELPNSALQTGDFYYRYDENVFVYFDGTKQVELQTSALDTILPDHIFLGKFANADNATQSIVGYDGTKTYLAYFHVVDHTRQGFQVNQLQSYTAGTTEGISWVSSNEALHHLSAELHKLIADNHNEIVGDEGLISQLQEKIKENADNIEGIEVPEKVSDTDALEGARDDGYLSSNQVRLNVLAAYVKEVSDDPELDTVNRRYAVLSYNQAAYDADNLEFGQMMFNNATITSATKVKIGYVDEGKPTQLFGGLNANSKIELWGINSPHNYEEPFNAYESQITAVANTVRPAINAISTIELTLSTAPSLTVGTGPNTSYIVAVSGKFKNRVVPEIQNADRGKIIGVKSDANELEYVDKPSGGGGGTKTQWVHFKYVDRTTISTGRPFTRIAYGDGTLYCLNESGDEIYAYTNGRYDSSKNLSAAVLRLASASIRPSDIVWDGSSLLVTDTANDAVWGFTDGARDATKDLSQTLLRSAASNISPRGIAWDGQSVYILDSANDAIWGFTNKARDASKDISQTLIRNTVSPRPSSIIWHNGSLLYLDNGAFEPPLVIAFTNGSVDTSKGIPSGYINRLRSGIAASGIASDGNVVFISDNGNQEVFFMYQV